MGSHWGKQQTTNCSHTPGEKQWVTSYLLWLMLFIVLCNLAALFPFIIYVDYKLFPQVFFQSLLFGVILLAPTFFIQGIKRYYLLLLYLVLFATGALYSAHIYIYKNLISPSTLYAIFETNHTEAIEFFQQSIPVSVILIVFATWSLPLYPLHRAIQAKPMKSILFTPLVLVAMIVAAITIVDKPYKRLSTYYVSSPFVALATYSADKEKMNKISGQLARLPENIQQTLAQDSQKILGVVILGESAARKHLKAYGYFRETTPYTDKLSQSGNGKLVLFTDAITEHATTLLSLSKMFTAREPEADLPLCSINSIFSAAGMKTVWISNQPILGANDLNTTVLANACDKRFFLSSDPGGVMVRAAKYDEIVLPVIETVLNSNNDNKFMVVHIMGSHTKYAKRYPAEFSIFSDRPARVLQRFSDEEINTINEYDNSIVYTDFIVSSIIESVQKKDCPAFVLYIGDHGESIYDVNDIVGHNELPYKVFYDIPMMLWLSPEYTKLYPELVNALTENCAKPFISSNLLFLLSDLLRIDFKGNEHKKSPSSLQFAPDKRRIAGRDYEQLPD